MSKERAVEALSRFIFPYEIVEGTSSLIEVRKLLIEGKGVILLTNHFSARDAIQGLQVFLRYLAPYSRKTVMPIARHMYRPWMAGVLKHLGVETYPIPDFSWEKIKETARQLPASERRNFFREGEKDFEKYLENAESALKDGGLVGLAAQAKREPKLKEPKAFPVKTLLEKTNFDRDKIFLVCVGIGFAEARDYSDPNIRGYNKGEKFVVKIGDVTNLNTISGEVDFWIHEQLKTLVPLEYL